MQNEFEETYHIIEDGYWWCGARRDMIYRLLKRAPKEAKLLEVGCAGGAFLGGLRERGFSDLWGIDISEKGIDLCRRRGFQNVFVDDASLTRFESGSFDIVIASDVLEHLRDDGAALQEWKRLLKPGGTLILFVPAYMFLWSIHDEANQHVRRYDKKDLLTLLQRAGFSIQRYSCWNFLLFFPIAVAKLLLNVISRRTRPKMHEILNVPAFVNRLLIWMFDLENLYLSWGFDFPVGLSLFAVCRK